MNKERSKEISHRFQYSRFLFSFQLKIDYFYNHPFLSSFELIFIHSTYIQLNSYLSDLLMFQSITRQINQSFKPTISKTMKISLQRQSKLPVQFALTLSGKRFYDIVNTDHLKSEGVRLKQQNIGLSNNLSANKSVSSIRDDVQPILPFQEQTIDEASNQSLNKEQILFKLFKTSTSVVQVCLIEHYAFSITL